MSDQLQLRRDTAANIAGATPADGELALATDTRALTVGDGATLGGVPLGLAALLPGGYVSGRYYFPGPTSASTVVVAANTLYVAPMIVLKKQTFTKIGAEIVTGAGTNARLGVYNWAGGLPSTLLVDGGAISSSSIGYHENTGLVITLNPGVYGLAFLPDNTPTVRIAGTGGWQWIANLQMGASNSGVAVELAINVPQAYGALPGTFPTASLAYQTSGPPNVGLRF